MDQDSAKIEKKETNFSLLPLLLNRTNGYKSFQFPSNGAFQRNIQESRLCAMSNRHQLELDNDEIYSLTGFPTKGVAVAVSKSGFTFMYLEKPQEGPHTWSIKSSSCRTLRATRSCRVEDVCNKIVSDSNSHEYEYYLFVQNCFMGGEGFLKPIPKSTDRRMPLLQISRGSYHFPRKAVWSCDWCPSTKQLAFGGEQFVALDGLDSRNRVTARNKGNVHSLLFNDDGNLLFCGTHKGEVEILDLRIKLRPVGKFYVAKGVSKLALIRGGSKLIASCFCNTLAQADLRMNKVVLFYPEHYNEHLKLPLSYCEMSDTLCSVGQDEVIRFWSLNGGHFLYFLTPNNGHQPHAWYSEQWCFNSESKASQGATNSKGIVTVAGSSVYLFDL